MWRWEKGRWGLDYRIQLYAVLRVVSVPGVLLLTYQKYVNLGAQKNNGNSLLKARINRLLKMLYTTTCPFRNLWLDHLVRLLFVEPSFRPQEERVKWRGGPKIIGAVKWAYRGDEGAICSRLFFSGGTFCSGPSALVQVPLGPKHSMVSPSTRTHGHTTCPDSFCSCLPGHQGSCREKNQEAHSIPHIFET